MLSVFCGIELAVTKLKVPVLLNELKNPHEGWSLGAVYELTV